MCNIAILGGGKLGTALAQSISNNYNVIIYARNKEVVDDINLNNKNSNYYSNLLLNHNIKATNDLNDLSKMDVVFLCVPSSVVREIMEKLKSILSKDCIIVSTVKGLEKDSFKRMSEVIYEIRNKNPVVFSGPNIALEIAENLATATTIAGDDDEDLNTVKKVLENDFFKVSISHDIVGVEYCGVIKNIIAISQGICEGMNINDNAKFALFTRSFKDTKELIATFGGEIETVDEYCGFGDIVTASTLSVSRNHTLGVLYGQKIVIDEKATGVLFEGKNTVKVFKEKCLNNNIKNPTIDFVYEVIIKKINPQLAFKKFWSQL